MNNSIRWPLYVGLALLCLNLIYVTFDRTVFWDLAVYQSAVDIHLNGGNAYTDIDGLKFVYPPLILTAMAIFGPYLSIILCGLIFGALLSFAHRGMHNLFWGLAISTAVFISPQIPQFYAFQTGNITAPLHILIIFALLHTNKGENLIPFLVIVAIASLIKPYYLAYLVVPFFFQIISIRLITMTGISAGVPVILFALQYLAMPDLVGQFLSALKTQAIGTNELAGAGRDVGRGLYYYLGTVAGLPRVSAVLLHFALLLPFAGFTLFATRKLAHIIDDERLRFEFLVFVGVIVAVILNPRLKAYDWIIMDAAAVGATIILFKAGYNSFQLKFWWLIMTTMIAVGVLGRIEETMWMGEIFAALPVYLPPALLALDSFIIFSRKTKLTERFQ
ncbi:hypothetical protein [Maritalea porphyrae]|uniref:DUF2029 domain-containing protein n=1 Tax=Maritalea porphyrae TaxID=880732 RepID=A0ABQ5UN52_9HYPH|nr:hypothetical protein [Maritalea porphyrae]GLQ16269.1 hypothetical protein GCM10007879_05180 [Maritalea porphyrae]